MIIDKWRVTGLLEKCESVEQEKELSELLEKNSKFLIERNKKDFVSSVMLPAITRLFYDNIKIDETILIEELEGADKLNLGNYNEIDEEFEKSLIAIENYKKRL